MSRTDFCLCTPIEFSKIYNTWLDVERRKEQNEWERVRWSGMCFLQVYSKKALKPQDIIVFPWEEKIHKNKKTISTEEENKRYEEAKKKYGLT